MTDDQSKKDPLPYSLGSGFHRLDPDWTRGRSQAVGEAEAISRSKVGILKVTLMGEAKP